MPDEYIRAALSVLIAQFRTTEGSYPVFSKKIANQLQSFLGVELSDVVHRRLGYKNIEYFIKNENIKKMEHRFLIYIWYRSHLYDVRLLSEVRALALAYKATMTNSDFEIGELEGLYYKYKEQKNYDVPEEYIPTGAIIYIRRNSYTFLRAIRKIPYVTPDGFSYPTDEELKNLELLESAYFTIIKFDSYYQCNEVFPSFDSSPVPKLNDVTWHEYESFGREAIHGELCLGWHGPLFAGIVVRGEPTFSVQTSGPCMFEYDDTGKLEEIITTVGASADLRKSMRRIEYYKRVDTDKLRNFINHLDLDTEWLAEYRTTGSLHSDRTKLTERRR